MWYVNFNHKSYPWHTESEARSFAEFWNMASIEFIPKSTSFKLSCNGTHRN